MYWLELKGALLYGQPQITNDMLQPEALKCPSGEFRMDR